MRRLRLTLVALLIAPAARAEEPNGRPNPSPQSGAAALAFFENKIRPVLVRECYSCHSAETKKGPKAGLLLDSRAGWQRGGDSGPAIVPGQPADSLLIKALHGDDAPEMPPKGKLPDEVIADFEKWVRMGAPDPRDGQSAPLARIDIARGKEFWSFRPVREPVPPRPGPAIDAFLAAEWEKHGLSPAPPADPYTLVRRLYIDLTGLPPPPDEVEAFVRDPSEAAYERLVDRLLASPRYGERWGRHWLDLARYADSNGKDENLTFHDAYRYRDYVIRSFNADKPFDRFIREQLAGDLLPAADFRERDELLTATGFLVIGPKILAERDKLRLRMDVVDEQIDTIGRVFLGLTLGCARCHDHKFDPVPTTDYYALAGILMSTRTVDGIKLGNAFVSGWMLRPLGPPEPERVTVARRVYEARLKTVQDEIKATRAALAKLQDRAAMRSPALLPGVTVDDTAARLVGTWKPSQYTRPYVGEGYLHDDKTGKGEKSATFTPDLPKPGDYLVLVSYTPGPSRAKNVPVTVVYDGGQQTVPLDQTRPPRIDNLFQPIGTFRFRAGRTGSVTISNAGTEGHVIVDAVRFVPAGELGNVAEVPMGVPDEVRAAVVAAESRLNALLAEEAALKKAIPPRPPTVMAVRDELKIEDARVNIRGNPHQLGPVVPRGVLQVATVGRPPVMPADQSGRKELADWIASPDNPLTARVAVNRIWYHLFGRGIVPTVDNFGTQGERPSHPELLDYLAARFQASPDRQVGGMGWSHKALIREIVTSRAYRLSVRADDSQRKADPENRLFARANRRRVEAEVIRDAILTVSGRLDLNGGGPVVSHLPERAIDNNSQGGFDTDPILTRAVYLPVIRNDLPPLFEVFDFADPEVASGQRDTTTVSTQALFLMNSTFTNTHARLAAERLLAEADDDAGRLDRLFRLALGRPPAPAETEQTLRFLGDYRRAIDALGTGRKPKNPELSAWQAVCLSVFGCHEFRFLE